MNRSGRPLVLLSSSFLLAILSVPLARGEDEDPQPAPPAKSPSIDSGQRALALLARLRNGDPRARDAAARELTELAAEEDERPRIGPGAQTQPRAVHDVLKRALRDDDPEVRFRVRRILGDPELRVTRVMEFLLEPQKTDDVVAQRKLLLERADLGSVAFGLVRIAKKALVAGLDADSRFPQEVWKPYGLMGSGQLHDELRFHMALDLLSDIVSDADVPGVAALLRESTGDDLDDIVNVLAARRDASRAVLKLMLQDGSDTARENAARALGEIGKPEDVPAIAALLEDRSPRVRRAAVSCFETIPVGAAETEKAAALANDPDPQVAIAALHVGSTFGRRATGPAAKKILGAGKGQPLELRIEAARALARLGDAATAASMLRPFLSPDPAVAEKEGRDELLKFAAWSAGAAGDRGSLAALEALAMSEGGTYEAGIYYAIARAGDVAFLRQLASKGADHARRLALRALGSAKGDQGEIADALSQAAEQAFEPKAGGRDENDFLAAYRALLDRSDDRARQAIGHLLEIAVTKRRELAVSDRMLATLVPIAEDALSKEAGPSLEKILTGPGDPWLRGYAADALSVVDPERAKVFLAEQVERAPNPEIQAAIGRALARLGERQHIGKAINISKNDVDARITGMARGFVLRTDVTGLLNTLGCDYAYAGQFDDAILCFRRMRWVKPDRIYNYSSYNIACSLSLAGHTDDSLRWLRRSIRDGFHEWRHMRADPDFININKDPRFIRLVEELRTEQEIDPVEDTY